MRRLGIGGLLLVVSTLSASFVRADDMPLRTVDAVDLTRYGGLWYEVAKIPNRFQDQCARNATAEYGLRDDGLIDVTNRCETVAGEPDKVKGVARVMDTESNSKLEVSFVEFWGWRPFWGDYWILGLADDYSWAVIGVPNRRYGWVLSRTPRLDEQAEQQVEIILRDNGYDPAVFISSSQDAP